MRVDPNPQGSDGWKAARLGVLTASDFDRIIAPKSMKPSTSMKGLVAEKVAEWATGCANADFSSGLTERGNDMEEEAAQFYALETGTEPEKVGLCLLDDAPVGASPDRLIGNDGLLEIKCPAPKAMVSYILDPEALRAEYLCQVQGQLWVTGRAWVDLFAYHPSLPPVTVRVERDAAFIEALSAAALRAVEVLEDAKALLRGRGFVAVLEAPPAPDPGEPSAEDRAAFDAMLARNAEPMPPPPPPPDINFDDLAF